MSANSIEQEVVAVLLRIGVHPGAIYAFQRTKFFVMGENIARRSPDELEKWNDAVLDWNNQHRRGNYRFPSSSFRELKRQTHSQAGRVGLGAGRSPRFPPFAGIITACALTLFLWLIVAAILVMR
jgi:hypothetical protein